MHHEGINHASRLDVGTALADPAAVGTMLGVLINIHFLGEAL